MNIDGLMSGRKGLILGLANERSIAWGISQQLSRAGAALAFSYQGEALLRRVAPMAEQLQAAGMFACDVTDPDSLDKMFADIKALWGGLDFVVHAVAFSDKNELKGGYLTTSRENFLNTMEISCYSFTAIAQRAAPLMVDGGALLTLTYFGGERVMPHYNVMGVAKAALDASVKYLAADLGGRNIRVNAISAGPIRTLAASGIGDFRYILQWNQINSPLRSNVTIAEVGNSAVYLLSDLARNVTGEIHHVDCGYNITGMARADSLQESKQMLDSYEMMKANVS